MCVSCLEEDFEGARYHNLLHLESEDRKVLEKKDAVLCCPIPRGPRVGVGKMHLDHPQKSLCLERLVSMVLEGLDDAGCSAMSKSPLNVAEWRAMCLGKLPAFVLLLPAVGYLLVFYYCLYLLLLAMH